MSYTDYLAEDTLDAPSASWHHTETSGTTAFDNTGAGNHATIGTGVTINQTSTIPDYDGPVFSMSGTSTSTLSAADADVFDADDTKGITHSRWLKMHSDGAGDVLYVIADKTALSQTNKQWYVCWDNRVAQGSPKRLRIQWGYNASASLIHQLDWSGDAARDALLAGGLLTVRFIWKSIGFIYWNDQLVASGILTAYDSPPPGNVANTRSLDMGFYNPGTAAGFFKGEFGPGHVWNTVLGEHRIRSRYASAIGSAITSYTKA